MQDNIAFLGFGEAAQAFLSGWRSTGLGLHACAYDIKTDNADKAIAAAKREDYERAGIQGASTAAGALKDAGTVFSLVTADEAENAARTAAATLERDTLFFDCNSCAPGTKKRSAILIESVGGRYVDVAVMAPVHPKRHRTPLLVSGTHAAEAASYLNGTLGMAAEIAEGPVGAASSIKMVRSVLMKGLEAVILECVLAGRRAGVEERVLDSLEETYPGFGWRKRAAYMMERAATHGIRRAAEMREVALTVRELGFSGSMSDATAQWEQAIGELKVDMTQIDRDDPSAVADALLAALDGTERQGRQEAANG